MPPTNAGIDKPEGDDWTLVLSTLTSMPLVMAIVVLLVGCELSSPSVVVSSDPESDDVVLLGGPVVVVSFVEAVDDPSVVKLALDELGIELAFDVELESGVVVVVMLPLLVASVGVDVDETHTETDGTQMHPNRSDGQDYHRVIVRGRTTRNLGVSTHQTVFLS
jgi:hypothetical protein